MDEKGNGYIFLGSNDGSGILRLKVTDYTNVSDPTIMPAPSAAENGLSAYMYYNKIGQTDNYLLTGFYAPLMIVDKDANVSFSMPKSTIASKASDPRVAYFNGARYLIMTSVFRSPGDSTTLLIYDITDGNNISEAMRKFKNSNPEPVYTYNLKGDKSVAPSARAEWYVAKDDAGKDQTLKIFTGSTGAGFAIIEFPKKGENK